MKDSKQSSTFWAMNDFVFSNPEYEELQNTCLSLAGKLDKARTALVDLRYGLFQSSDEINKLIDKTLFDIG